MSGTRILFVHHGSARGGAPLSLLYLMQALAGRGYENVVCSASCDAEVEIFFKEHGFQTCRCLMAGFAHTTGGGYALGSVQGWRQLLGWLIQYRSACQRFAACLARVRPDLVHLNSLVLTPYARVVRQYQMPCVVHVREAVLHGACGLRRRLLAGILRRDADHVIGICQDNLARLGLSGHKTSVIYNPVSFTKFDCRIDPITARNNLGIPDDARAVLFAGGCDGDIKGVCDFLRAMAELKQQEPRLVCLMPSFPWPMDPAQRVWTWKRRLASCMGIYRRNDERHHLLQANGLKDILMVSDFTYHMEQWLAAADVVCVPHILPHFSRTVLEAGAMRRPVVAYRIGGITEVVKDGKTGLLVPVGDVRGLAAAVRQLLGDEPRRQNMGQHGYEQTLRISAAETSAERVLAIYRDLLKEPRSCS